MFLAEMTWKEVEDLDRSRVVVVPFGAMEQHSIHLPLQTDAFIVEELCRRLDAACEGRLLILPTQWLGLSVHHIDFAGTLTASASTYLAMAGEILDSIAHAGFKKIFILNGHGGNSAILEVALGVFQAKYPEVQAAFTSYWKVAQEGIAKVRESPMGGIGHAGEMETSLLLAARPSLVRKGQMERDGDWPRSSFTYKDMQAFGPVSVWENFYRTSRHGGHGDPTTATAEKGERFFSAIVGRLAEFIKEMEAGLFWEKGEH